MKSLSWLALGTLLAVPMSSYADDLLQSLYPDGGGVIRVEVRGPLVGQASRVNDAGEREFTAAKVLAGNQVLDIDPSESKQALSRLLYWSEPRHGDGRQMYIHVTGRLEFRDERPVVKIGGRQEKGPWPYVVAEEVRIAPLYNWEVKRFMAGNLELPEKP